MRNCTRSICSGIPGPRSTCGRRRRRRPNAPKVGSGTCATGRRGSDNGWSASNGCLPTNCPTTGCGMPSEVGLRLASAHGEPRFQFVTAAAVLEGVQGRQGRHEGKTQLQGVIQEETRGDSHARNGDLCLPCHPCLSPVNPAVLLGVTPCLPCLLCGKSGFTSD